MKIKKQITSEQELDVDIKGVTLLSLEEYSACRDMVPTSGTYWWLRSPGSLGGHACAVGDNGSVYSYGYVVHLGSNRGVRPALIFEPGSSKLSAKDKVKVNDRWYTVISENMMLCDEIVGSTCFSISNPSEETNVYENSDVKKWLEG